MEATGLNVRKTSTLFLEYSFLPFVFVEREREGRGVGNKCSCSELRNRKKRKKHDIYARKEWLWAATVPFKQHAEIPTRFFGLFLITTRIFPLFVNSVLSGPRAKEGLVQVVKRSDWLSIHVPSATALFVNMFPVRCTFY